MELEVYSLELKMGGIPWEESFLPTEQSLAQLTSYFNMLETYR
tara:strand:- start:7557 stop:7685 length:129 start_codon:yes stop_codon:yes gene_type:complete